MDSKRIIDREYEDGVLVKAHIHRLAGFQFVDFRRAVSGQRSVIEAPHRTRFADCRFEFPQGNAGRPKAPSKTVRLNWS